MLFSVIGVFSGFSILSCKGFVNNFTFNSQLYNVSQIMRRVYAMDPDPPTYIKVFQALQRWKKEFEEKNIPEPKESIEYILAHVMDIYDAPDLYKPKNLNKTLYQGQETMLNKLCYCRLARMPVQYIVKEWDFRELRLRTCPPVFIPRPETEEIVDLIKKESPSFKTFLEVGAGNGAISMALVAELPKVKGTTIDRCPFAWKLARQNRWQFEMEKSIKMFKCKLFDNGTLSRKLNRDQFDLIVSNPPYVPSKLMSGLEPEITVYEDLNALDGGEDGLRVIKAIMILAKRVLKPNGHMFLEVDVTHPEKIKSLVQNNTDCGLEFVRHYKDIYGRDRFVQLKRNSITYFNSSSH